MKPPIVENAWAVITELGEMPRFMGVERDRSIMIFRDEPMEAWIGGEFTRKVRVRIEEIRPVIKTTKEMES